MKALLKNNEGIALPIVVSIIAVITLLGFTAFFVVDSQTTMGAHYEKSETALSIAEAGVNEYLWHLNRDPQFYETEEGRKYVKDSDGNPKVHDVQNGQYTLEIEPPSDSQRVIKIKATGWLKSDKTVKAAIEVDVRKRGFLQNLYLSHIEELSNGEKIWWTSGDELFGPLHTNGDLNIDGNPVFHDRVTYTKNKNIRSGSNPVFYDRNSPQQADELRFPINNSQLIDQALANGLYLKGRTCIYLDGDKIKIRNNWKYSNNFSRYTSPVEIPISDIKNGVIYVDDNTSATGGKWDINTGNVFISGTLDGRLTIAAKRNIYITGSDPTDYNNPCSPYSDGGIFYKNTNFNLSDDMLGLIANEYIYILTQYWPWDSDSYYRRVNDVAPQNITVHAAVFAINKSFGVERYDQIGLKGTIHFVGSICQHRRGAVSMFGDRGLTRGYKKNYKHDPRMAYESPPLFLEPENAGWEIISWKRVAP